MAHYAKIAENWSAVQLIDFANQQFSGDRLALVSSFGAEAALLLSLVAEVNPKIAVLFLETGKHFPETLDYCVQLTKQLGLGNVIKITPDLSRLREADAAGDLWKSNVDGCCQIRKVESLARALAAYQAWINGRKRYQAGSRTLIAKIERDGERLKFNPLADWSREQIAAEFDRRNLPHHPLEAYGYLSIGCAPCTHAVAADEDPRGGRWRSADGKVLKTECGIHTALLQ